MGASVYEPSSLYSVQHGRLDGIDDCHSSVIKVTAMHRMLYTPAFDEGMTLTG